MAFLVLVFPASLSANSPTENALFHYFSDEPEIALVKLDILLKENPNDPVINEYMARCNWSLIKRLLKVGSTSRGRDLESLPDLDKLAFEKIERYFLLFIERAVSLSKYGNNGFKETKNPEAAYNLAMALSTKSAYLFQIYGKKRAVEAAGILDEAVVYIKFCIKDPSPYCLAYSPLGAIQYFLNKEVTSAKKIGYILFAKFKVPNLYKTINFDKDEAIEYLEIANRCSGPSFRKTEALFLLAEFFMDFEGNPKKRAKNDIRAYPILEELHKTYPNNKKIGEYLHLVRLHLKNKAR